MYNSTETISTAPKITAKPEIRVDDKEHTVTFLVKLECSVGPPNDIQWFFNDKPIKSEGRYTISVKSEGSQHELSVVVRDVSSDILAFPASNLIPF